MKAVELLVIQPTPFCNINCSYCYLPDRSNPKKITIDIVERLIDSLVADHLLNKELSIVWHAGEPLVLPPAFYKPFFALLKLKLKVAGISLRHCIQTNGTLITQEWCDFINQYQIKIGVSIDGPQQVHDANRKTRAGQGTFDKVMNGINLLKKNNISYHGIAVVNEHSIDDAKSFFNFFYETGFYELGLNIEEVEGGHKQSSVFLDAMFEKVTTFYSQLFKLYSASDKKMKIREFDRCLGAIMRNPEIRDITKLSTESHQNIPIAILSVDYLGNYSTFSPELIGQQAPAYNNFILGNIGNSNFSDLKTNSILLSINTAINDGIQKCKKECEFFNVCGGGAPANKYFENGTFDSSETKYCKYNIKVPTELVLSYLEEKLSL